MSGSVKAARERPRRAELHKRSAEANGLERDARARQKQAGEDDDGVGGFGRKMAIGSAAPAFPPRLLRAS